MYKRVQRIRKLRTQTLWWVPNLNLRHIHLIRVLIFGAVFARLASKFEKVLIWPKKKFEKKIKIKILKNAEFHTDFKSVEKVLEKCTKKVIRKTSFTNISKSGKSAYFCHVFANYFFYIF
jgi:hypothetical protein